MACSAEIDEQNPVLPGPPKVCQIMNFMASLMGLGLFVHILLGFRFELIILNRNPYITLLEGAYSLPSTIVLEVQGLPGSYHGFKSKPIVPSCVHSRF